MGSWAPRIPEIKTHLGLSAGALGVAGMLTLWNQENDARVIQRRLRGAAEEVQNYTQYDFVLINRDIEEASARLANIVEAERLRKARMEAEVGPILESFKI